MYERERDGWIVHRLDHSVLIQMDQIPSDQFKYRTAIPVPVSKFQQLQQINRLGMSKVQDSGIRKPTSFPEFLMVQADWVQARGS